jgi:hypothetical protein
MSIDKNICIISTSKIPTILRTTDQSEAREGNIFVEDNYSGHEAGARDLEISPDSEDFAKNGASVFFEQARQFKKVNGRLPVFKEPEAVGVYQRWEDDPENNGYPDCSHIENKYRPSEIRKLVIKCAEEAQSRFSKVKGNWRTEIITHEQGHLDLDLEFGGIPGIATDISYDLLLKSTEYAKDKVFPEASELIELANQLNRDRAKLLNIGETIAMFAEQDRCELDPDMVRYSESFRVVSLLVDWVRNNPIEEYRHNVYRIDEHDIGTLILLFGENIVDTNNDALIDFQKIAEESSQYKLLAQERATLDQVVMIALLDKAEEMLDGEGKIFIGKDERLRIEEKLKQLVPQEMERTILSTEKLCQVTAEVVELRDVSEEVMRKLGKIKV